MYLALEDPGPGTSGTSGKDKSVLSKRSPQFNEKLRYASTFNR